jgi:hypothetical protein
VTSWGGYRNGEIPLSALTFVGKGALSGADQYLHPTVAVAWRALVSDFRQAGANLTITEGYRTLALQRVYWNQWQAGTGPSAAVPGTSSHGWATAVDMANYQSVPLATRRTLIQNRGFATGERWGEPWHIEYVASLSQSGGGGTPVVPEEEETVPIMLLSVTGDPAVWAIGNGFDYKFASSQELESFTNVATKAGFKIEPVQQVGSWTFNLMRRALVQFPAVPTAAQNAAAVDTRLAPRFAAISTGGGTTDLQPVLDAIAKVPTAKQNGVAARAEIVK